MIHSISADSSAFLLSDIARRIYF